MENVLTHTNVQSDTRIRRRWVWPALLVLLLLSIAFVAIPVFLIQPFRPQTQRALEISYLLRSWSPLATAVILLAAFALVIWQWGQARRWWRKALLVVLLLPRSCPPGLRARTISSGCSIRFRTAPMSKLPMPVLFATRTWCSRSRSITRPWLIRCG